MTIEIKHATLLGKFTQGHNYVTMKFFIWSGPWHFIWW